jgi:cobalt-zinc-cadmium efflux system outer membrane protein
MVRVPLAAAAAAVLLVPGPVSATVLTFEDALDRARREAPAVVAARLRPDEARGRLAGAAVLLRENPVLEVTGGRRESDRGVSTDVETALGQTFELGRRRHARIAGARADVEQALASVEETTRETLRDVAAAFLRAVAAAERVDILAENEAVAARLLAAAERRHAAGDVSDLDAGVARVAAVRTRAGRRAAEAARELAIRDLKVALGIDAGEPVDVRGDLRARRPSPLPALLAAVPDRPDFRALREEARAADAEARLGAALRWPDVGVHVGYKREEDADVPLAGVSVSVPVFANGQVERATGAARARRLRVALHAGLRAAEVEIRAGFAAQRRLDDAVADLERHALPVVARNEGLVRRGYEAGELSLPDYLLVRREALDARLDHVDRALDAALAAVDVESRAGVLR